MVVTSRPPSTTLRKKKKPAGSTFFFFFFFCFTRTTTVGGSTDFFKKLEKENEKKFLKLKLVRKKIHIRKSITLITTATNYWRPISKHLKAFKRLAHKYFAVSMGFLKKIEGHLIAPKADVNLQLADQYFVLGDNLEGIFTVSPHEDIQADEIRCEIKCLETTQVMRTEYDPAIKSMVTRQVTENRILYQVKPVCSQTTELVNGSSRAFKFSTNIPAGSRPTYTSTGDLVQWEIKGVVAVHGRPDVTSKEMQFQVISQSQRPTNEPPKLRLVACQYCQTDMLENTLVCPNCGARRSG